MKARPDILSAGNAKPTLTNNLFRMKNFVLQLALALSLLAGGGSTAWAAGTRQMAEETRITVSGKVIDAKRKTPLVGVNVTVEGTSTGVTTGMDGIYRIQLTPGQSLRFSYLGYADHVAKISEAVSHLDVQLEESSTSLDDVVVVAYGTQRKGDVLSSISTTGSKELMRAPVSTTSGALIGKIAGVNSRNTEGTPGSSANIQIRNLGTPLYVIDGVVSDAGHFNQLGLTDIESISVIKDGAAAIYGVKAANGVVLVQTKRGKNTGGRISVGVNAYYGWQSWNRFPEMGNAYEVTRAEYEGQINSGVAVDVAAAKERLQKYKERSTIPRRARTTARSTGLRSRARMFRKAISTSTRRAAATASITMYRSARSIRTPSSRTSISTAPTSRPTSRPTSPTTSRSAWRRRDARRSARTPVWSRTTTTCTCAGA